MRGRWNLQEIGFENDPFVCIGVERHFDSADVALLPVVRTRNVAAMPGMRDAVLVKAKHVHVFFLSLS